MEHHFPSFSVIIPTYNRPQQLSESLESLARLTYRRDRFEVIVVDDGGCTALSSVIAPYDRSMSVKLIRQSHAGPAAARNTGAAQAKGRFLVFTDDDCFPAPNWLESLAARFSEMPDCALGGAIVNALPHNRYSTATQQMLDRLYLYFNADPKLAQFFTTMNLAVPRDRFCALGGFDITFKTAAGEDREFSDRWLRHGFNMIYAPEVLVYHKHDLTLRSFWRQHVRYGRGAFQHHAIRAERGSGRIRLESRRFYSDLLHFPLATCSRQKLTSGILMIIIQIATVTGFFLEASRKLLH